MFFEFVHAVLTLDLNWLAWLLFANLHYLFAFAALCFFFWNGTVKKTVIAFLLLSIVAWTWVDFELISGWVLFVGGFLSIYYTTKIVVLVFAEEVPQLQKHLVIVSELQFIVLIVIYNLFLR